MVQQDSPQVETITPEQSATLNELLPSEHLLSAMLAFELGRAIGDGLYLKGHHHYNETMKEMGHRLREWLVNPPAGKYTF